MKFIRLLIILLIVVVLGGCVKSNPINCSKRLDALTKAADQYSQDPTKENCKLYYQALKDYINSNACAGDVFYKSYQKEFNQSSEDDFCN